jgi:hypothetical protein
MRPECRPRDLEIQVVRAAGRGGRARSALKVRDNGRTGPLTSGSGRLGSKDPVVISGCMAYHCKRGRVGFSPGKASLGRARELWRIIRDKGARP